MKNVFLTGGMTFVGKALTRKLLDNPKITLHSLVSKEKQEILQKFRSQLSAEQNDRFITFSGKVTDMDLGLSGTEVSFIQENIDTVFHLEFKNRIGVRDKDIQEVNVDGTRNIIEFSKELKNLKHLLHVSSCFVSGNRIGVIQEDELDCGQSFRNLYEKTKFEAEILMERAKKDLPISILRPSIILGDSKNGAIEYFDGIYYTAILIVTSPVAFPLPLPGQGVAPLNLIPIDFLVNAACVIAQKEEAIGKTFHIVDPNPLSARQVCQMIADRAGKRLSKISISPRLARFILNLPFVKKFSEISQEAVWYLNHLAIYNNSNTLEILDGHKVLCPPFASYVDNLIAFVRTYYKERKNQAVPGVYDPLDNVESARIEPMYH